jgi:hypothetical protein
MMNLGWEDPETFTEWASAHGPTKLVLASGEEVVDVFLMPTGRDKALAELRVATWRESHPEVPSWLLRREVTRGPWEKVEE